MRKGSAPASSSLVDNVFVGKANFPNVTATEGWSCSVPTRPPPLDHSLMSKTSSILDTSHQSTKFHQTLSSSWPWPTLDHHTPPLLVEA